MVQSTYISNKYFPTSITCNFAHIRVVAFKGLAKIVPILDLC